MALFLVLFGIWIGTTTAHELKGWRTILLPLVYVATLVIAVVFLVAVIEGTVFTADGLLRDIGLIPGL